MLFSKKKFERRTWSFEELNREFRSMTDAQLDREFMGIAEAPGEFFSVRAIFVLDERIRRIEERLGIKSRIQ